VLEVAAAVVAAAAGVVIVVLVDGDPYGAKKECGKTTCRGG
jgi:hypothetical protein